jgi:hypothetical protein
MKLNFDMKKALTIISIAQAIPGLVKQVQESMKGAKGIEKHEVVVDALMKLLAAAEGVTEQDLLNDAQLRAFFDQVIVTEKAALKAREALALFLADFKANRTGNEG